MRSGKLLLLFCSAIYLIICVVMAVSQRSFIYHPRVFTREEVERRAQGTKLERWTNSTGEFIGFKHLSVRQPADGIVLIAYGNGSTAIGSNRYVNDIQSAANLDVYILEYPGYEDRPGEPSEASLFTAAAEAFQLLSTNKPAYLVGESLGSGVASYLAGTYPDKVAGIFLISPFNNLAAVAQNHFPFLPVWPLVIDRFPSEKYLQNYHGRVGVSVDGRDIVVPEKFGLKLYNNYNGPKKLWEFPDGEHCQILKPPAEFWHEVIEFWQND
ncbi:MAG TPA: alpha/beta fold hydrolase [Verrucomicrobiae bacterium]|nr:alpha/beta fold hydrolase [Verrucomicrobiae bacterium]